MDEMDDGDARRDPATGPCRQARRRLPESLLPESLVSRLAREVGRDPRRGHPASQ